MRRRRRRWLALCVPAAAFLAFTSLQCAVMPFSRVLIVGATHGDEFAGPWVINRIKQSPELMHRPSFRALETALSNPEAYQATRRFLHADLNRQFRQNDLEDASLGMHEELRAKFLNALYGPKEKRDSAVDFVVDLHSSTSAMGITYIVQDWSDAGIAAAAWCQEKLQPLVVAGRLPPVRILFEEGDRASSPYLMSVGREGLMIEVGPVPQGVLKHDVCLWMEAAASAVMDFLEALNSGYAEVPERALVYKDLNVKVPAPQDELGKPEAIFHRSFQDRDYQPLRKGDPIYMRANGEVIRYNGSHGNVVWPVFVNEGAYYFPESGLGFDLTVQKLIRIPAVRVATSDVSH